MRLNPQTCVLTAVAHQRRRVFRRDTIAEFLIATAALFSAACKAVLQ
jgi:hypothetical protein